MKDALPVCPNCAAPLWSAASPPAPRAGAYERTQVPDIFDEVDEDLRADRAQKLLQRYAGVLIAAFIAVIACVGAWQGWKYYETREALRLGTIYLAAMRDADAVPPGPNAVAGFAQVAKEADSGYRSLARMRQAALAAQSGQAAEALALWDQVASDSTADRLLRDTASLHWALAQIDSQSPADGLVEARLKTLVAPTNPLRALADEGLGLLALRQGKLDAARATFKQLAQDVTAPQGVRGRANGLLTQLGG